jgi:tripartite ATP-independent transporter DctP family solute receptor
MKAIRGILPLILAFSLIGLVPTSPVFGAAKEVQIKCGVPGALSELYVQGMLAIADAVKAEGTKQGYDIKLQVFPNSSLGGGSQQAELELLQAGAIQMVNYSSANFAAFEPKISIISMPFLFADFDDAYKFYSSPFVEEITAGLDKKGMKVLGMFTRGFRQLTNSKRPVRTLNDVKGLKVRVMNSPLYVSIFDALDAKAVPMSFSEVYTGLQLGTIDGQENSADTTKSAKVYEVQKYMTLWNYSTDSSVIAVSTKWWDGLDAQAKTIITTAVKNEEKRQYTLVKQKEDEALDSLKGSLKIDTLAPGEQAKLREATRKVWDKYENVFGKDLIDRVQKFTKK